MWEEEKRRWARWRERREWRREIRVAKRQGREEGKDKREKEGLGAKASAGGVEDRMLYWSICWPVETHGGLGRVGWGGLN